jgi:hypothetical protein
MVLASVDDEIAEKLSVGVDFGIQKFLRLAQSIQQFEKATNSDPIVTTVKNQNSSDKSEQTNIHNQNSSDKSEQDKIDNPSTSNNSAETNTNNQSVTIETVQNTCLNVLKDFIKSNEYLSTITKIVQDELAYDGQLDDTSEN